MAWLLALAAQAEALHKFSHPNVLHVIGAHTVVPRCFLVMERSPHGALHELLHNQQVREMSLSLCLRVLRDVADGMRCLHEHATLHLNLRSANLMIFDRFVVKVSDARLRPEWAAMGAQFKRAEGWAAPELLQHV